MTWNLEYGKLDLIENFSGEFFFLLLNNIEAVFSNSKIQVNVKGFFSMSREVVYDFNFLSIKYSTSAFKIYYLIYKS